MLNNYKNTVKSWNKLYEVETKKGKSSKGKLGIFNKKIEENDSLQKYKVNYKQKPNKEK